jgi:hypothetical protein
VVKMEPMAQEALALRAAGASNVVRVAMPVEVAFNLDKFQKVQVAVFEKLGHSRCVSGWDVRYDFIRQFVVNAQGQLIQAEFGS